MITLKKLCIACSIILIIFLVLYYGFNMRYYTFFNVDQAGFCNSIKDSKFIRVFISEYKPEIYDINLEEKIKFTIKELWIEKMWIYSNDFRKPHIYKTDIADCKIILITENNDLKYHGIIWMLEEMAAPTYKQNYGNLLRRSIRHDEVKDTLHIKILKKNPQTNEFTDSIGVIRFFKVKE